MENKTEEASIIDVSTLTCIDLDNPDLHQSAVLLKQECLECGAFYVINHGISEELKNETFEQSKKFFALPLEEKMKVLRNEKHRGYAPMHDSLLDPKNQVQGDYKEGFTIGMECPKGCTDGDTPFYSANIWPNPDVLPEWRETMEKYYQEALRVCRSVARIMALALDLDADYFNTPEMLGNPIANMILFHYEGTLSDPSKGIFACGAHSDYGMMTLLATDSVMGLQICKDKDAEPRKWEYIPSIKGAYILNLGDMLERWSNGLFKSTLHRVIGNGQERYSNYISDSVLRESEPRVYNRVSSYLPVPQQTSQISSDQMFNVRLPTLQSSTCAPKTDLGEAYGPRGPCSKVLLYV